jgi:hypothetical protein
VPFYNVRLDLLIFSLNNTDIVTGWEKTRKMMEEEGEKDSDREE